MRKPILIFYLWAMALLTIEAQTMTVNAPSNVQNGENFRLSFSVNTQDASDFRIGEIPDALEIITGPYTSTQTSFQMVNGHTSSSSSKTFTFILCANKNGTFVIPAAHVQVNGKSISSQPVKITVSGTPSTTNGAPPMHDDHHSSHQQMRAAGTAISNNDLFIKVSANKKRVHEQEAVLLTYKVYTLVELINLKPNMPDLTGFHTQEVKLPPPSYHLENVNGRNYQCVTWSQYVLYPQMTGELEIPTVSFDGTVIQKNNDVDPFEAFFNGGSGYVEVKRSIKAPGMKIQVDPLPQRPDGFSGGVGKFTISAQLNKTDVKANDPITVRVVVSGNGNLKLIKQPVVAFPKDFDKYDPKVTDKTQLTVNGVEGNMIYDFLAVPRNQGKYTIPPIEFTYYDTGSNAYKTLKTQSFEINVAKGSGSGNTSANFAEEINKDIHPIKTGKDAKQDTDSMFFGSSLYWGMLLLLFAIFMALMIIFRHRAVENADIVKMRGKRANKVATKRLRTASKLMSENRQGEFYDEVLRALWGYVGDKLDIPVTELSHENIREKLANQQVDEDTIEKFSEALNECEYERYAPGDPAGNMNKTFDSAMNAIMKIEDSIKRKGKKAGRNKTMACLAILFISSLQAQAITKADADAEYSKGNYQQAIKGYEELLKKGSSADLLYNLGNAYYRTDNIPKAVLNYERAALLSPADEDIRFNLQMARSKTIDKITPESEMFFFTWYRSLVNLMNVDGWAHLAIFSIILALVLALIYLFSGSILLRKVGFFGGIFFLLLFLFSNVFAFQQREMLQRHNGAIVVAPSVTIRKTPAMNGSEQGVIHEGTRVDIIDDTMKDWKEIHLADGREGWVVTSSLEKI